MSRGHQEYLEGICRRLVEYDQDDIVEIVQFGSSVYAPDCSRDIDLLVITKRAKEYEGQRRALTLNEDAYSCKPMVGANLRLSAQQRPQP